MKKRFSLIVMVSLFAVQAFPQNAFVTAMNEAVAEIRQKVPLNASIAVTNVVIPHEVMAEQSAILLSDFLITELGSKLLNTGRFKVLERQKINMDAVQASLSFDASGNVSDESAQNIGHFLGAEYLVIGSLRMFRQELVFYVETVKAEQAEKIATTRSESISSSELSALYSAQAWTPPQSVPVADQTYTTSNTGVYVGIVSFGADAEDLTRGAPIFLDADGLSRINNILDNDYKRTSRSGTLLFYGVHRALAALSANAGRYPGNLDGVYLVTFTDGLDAGSTGFLAPVENQVFSDKFESDYQAYLRRQIVNRPVAGRAITSYSAGVRGTDVQDTAMFRSSLSSLASSPANFYELDNFSELNEKFDAIAKNLTVTTTNRTFVLRTASFPRDTKIRMTFDGVDSPEDSKRYVEGMVEPIAASQTYRLTNINYNGTSSNEGPEVLGVMDKGEVLYTFANFTGYDDVTDKQVKQWLFRNGSTEWQVNSEYEAANSININTEYKSAVVYIALDSSRSLSDSDILAVRTAMKQFVQTLYDRSQNKSAPPPVDKPAVSPSPAPVPPPVPPPSPAPAPPPAPPPSVRPQAPRNLRAGTPGTDQVTLTWDSAGAGVSYRVYHHTQDDWYFALSNPATGTSMDVTSLASGTSYYFWVSSVKDGLESAKSPMISVRTAEPTPPKPPDTGFDEERFFSVGAFIGTSFTTPLFIGTLQGTFSLLRYSFFEIGCDFGFIHDYEDWEGISYFSLYPFAHLNWFVGGTGFLYAGIGGGLMAAFYTGNGKDTTFYIPAFDVAIGLYLGGITFTYTIRATSEAVNSKLAIGYNFRFK